MGTQMKRVCLGRTLVVADFFITFCLRYFDLLSNRLGNGFVDHCLREPQATVEVVLIRVMKGVAWFFLEVDCVARATQSPKLRTLHLDGNADETGLPRQNAGSGGFFKHRGT